VAISVYVARGVDVEIVGTSMKMAASGISPVPAKMATRKGACSIFLIFAGVLVASSCGGGSSSNGSTGGQGSGQGSVSFSTSAISFNAAGPFAQSPATQTITGTVTGVSSGTLYVTVVASNPSSFFTVTSVTITGNSGQIGVIPALPSTLSAGNFSGSITVNVCLNDLTCKTGQLIGSPQVIPVAYNIASGVDGDTVTPRVVQANAAGTAILRGAGFTGATSVSFGSSAATSVSAVSDSEIDVSYSALTAGTYPITINSGGISYTASLVAVAPPAFSPTSITSASGAIEIQYDAQRAALLVLLAGAAPNNELQRYAFDGNTGTWGSPTQVQMQNAMQFSLSSDGSRLLVLVQDPTSASIVELDSVSLQQINVTNVPNVTDTCGFALANDGNAIIGRSSSPGLIFGTFSDVFISMSAQDICPTVASGNGAIVAMNCINYAASKETVTQPGTTGTSADLAGDKFVNGDAIESQTGQVLGYLSTPFDVVNWAGTRAYGYAADPISCAPTLTTFDLTALPSGNPTPQFPVLGSPIALPSSCLNGTNFGYRLAISPDGATVFIARPDGLVVQPVP